MEFFNALTSHFSWSDILLMIFALAGAIKVAFESWDYFYNKIKGYFFKEHQSSANLDTISQQIQDLAKTQGTMEDQLTEQLDSISTRVDDISKETKNMQDRMQDDTRSYIIDKYRRFVCEKGCIDAVSLEDVERHYMYYQAAKGDSYITNLMTKIRSLPVDVPEANIHE